MFHQPLAGVIRGVLRHGRFELVGRCYRSRTEGDVIAELESVDDKPKAYVGDVAIPSRRSLWWHVRAQG